MKPQRIIASVVALLALSAGVAYAATQRTTSDGTQVCVNNTNGLMRVASSCRADEYPLTIGGGGGNVQVTQNGTFRVNVGESVAKTLPLTGITVSGVCKLENPNNMGESVNSYFQLDAASGKTMDIPHVGMIGGQSKLFGPIAGAWATNAGANYPSSVLVTSNAATATITVSAWANYANQQCIYLWQAVEAPN